MLTKAEWMLLMRNPEAVHRTQSKWLVDQEWSRCRKKHSGDDAERIDARLYEKWVTTEYLL